MHSIATLVFLSFLFVPTAFSAAPPALRPIEWAQPMTAVGMKNLRQTLPFRPTVAAIDELINGGYGYHAIYGNIPALLRQVDVTAIRTAVLAP